MKRNFLIVLSIGCLAAQIEQRSNQVSDAEQFVARVEVCAFDSRGTFLAAPTVRVFESESHKDFSTSFRSGVADHIPFGIYKLEAYMSGFYPEVRYVAIYRPQVTVVVGLAFGREALTLPQPPTIHGKVIGSLPRDKKIFAKLAGIYSDRALESKIGRDGDFDFGVPWDGRYLLLIVSEDAILASRTIDIPYMGRAIEIKIGER
jgi:hypothetical protein